MRAAALTVLLLVGIAIIADGTAAAGAADGTGRPGTSDAPVELLLSTDGVTFAPSPSGEILRQTGALVPGGSVSTPLWVRNPTDARATWRAEVREILATSDSYAEAVTLSTWHIGGARVHALGLDDLSPCVALVTSSLPPGGTAKMLFAFGMDPGADNSTQGQAATLRIALTMRDSAGGPPGSPCEDGAVAPDSARPAALAHTGTASPVAAIAAGALALGGGLAHLARRRGIGGER